MDLTKPSPKQALVQELMKSSICCSIHGAEIMADEIMCREKETIEECKEQAVKVEEKLEEGKEYLTKQQFESLIKINNKIVEANFVKLKEYTDGVIAGLKSQIVELKKRPVVAPVETKKEEQTQIPAAASKKDGEFSAEDVSIEKMFYCGNR